MKFSIFNFQFSILLIIIVVASVFRFWSLGVVPPSPDWDEAALGYNAYSILHTARDEYGVFLPPVLRSFDDYKPALYSYLAISSVAIFGLNTWAVRLPSAIFGIFSVLGVYFLVEELCKKKNLALLAAFFFAISPWSIQFSRIAFESNVGTALNIFGALFFLKGLTKRWLLFLSITCFVASAYVYQSEKVFSPLLLFALIIIYWKQLLKIPKKYISAVVILGFLISIPMLFFIVTNKNALERAAGVSVFSDTSSLKQTTARLIVDHQNHDYLGLFLDNRRVIFAKEIIGNYLSHFDFNWLFITGDLSRHHAPNMGLLYLWELPFVLLGMYFLLFGEYDKKTKWLIFSWYLLAPVAASVTTGVPHAVRSLNFLPIYQIYSAIGVLEVVMFVRKKKNIFFSMVLIAWMFLAIFNIGYYLDQYFVQLNYYTSADWQYGYQQAVSYVEKISPQYNKIVVSNVAPLDQSYIFFLFYLRYNPALYQQETKNVSGGFAENHSFGKYSFRPIDWNTEVKSPNTLYVGRPGDFPSDAHVLKTITYLNGTSAIEIVSGK